VYSLIIGLAVVVAAPGKDAPKKDAPTLVGEWVPTEALQGGKPDLPPAGTSIAFTADGKVLMKGGNAAKPEEGTYKIDAKKNPAEIDLTPPEKEKGPTILGIYKFEKDKLIICLTMAGERPKEFASPAGSQLMLITLERAKRE
jgi:uncharacterized protein (TIGR03067 family)